ncbi:MAG: glycosyl hydrolase family 2, partial [Bacteroidota bacterium]|nr:glycosyl hydrolase family 2 [Bacteroidota bacterium]
LPDDVPGLSQLQQRQAMLKNCLADYRLSPFVSSYFGKPFQKGRVMYGNCLQDMLEQVPCTHEDLVSVCQANFIRRKTEDGYIYFVALQKNRPIDQWVSLGVAARSVLFFNPLTGEKGKARLRISNGLAQVYLQLKPGQSMIIRTYNQEDVAEPLYPVYQREGIDFLNATQPVIGMATNKQPKRAKIVNLHGKWTFRFTEGDPAIPGTFIMRGTPVSWTDLPVKASTVYAGTGRYTLKFKLTGVKADDWRLNLNGLAESARVYLNGQYAGEVWSLPYTLNVGRFLKPGKANLIEIDVTNLPANRIADYDRRGVKWRIFKEINFVDVTYNKTLYDKWPIMPSGLTRPISLEPLYIKSN